MILDARVDRQQPPASGVEALWDLERFLAESSEGHRGLPEVEIGCERRGRELVRLALQAHLDQRGDGDVGPAVVVEDAEGRVRLSYRRVHTRRLLTIFGEVSITRLGYGAPGHASIHPLDAELQLPGRAYSYELSRRLVRAAVCGPFDEAVALIALMTGVVVPKRSAEVIVVDAAKDFDSFYAERPESCAKPADGEILVGAIDCKGIPMVKPRPAAKVVRRTKGQKANKKKMATVGAVFSQPPYVRTTEAVLDSLFATAVLDKSRGPRRRPHHKRVWASLVSGKDCFIADVQADAPVDLDHTGPTGAAGDLDATGCLARGPTGCLPDRLLP
jgi:hypothetical protein